MGKMKKKYEGGESSHYMTRKQALRKLQLSLKMFRKLCILKGIYPREPKNRKRAQKGATDKKTLYLKKDVQFLLHEPIVWTLREHKVYLRKKGRAKAIRDPEALKRIVANKPSYKLDHIVKERYPTFIDAIRDLDDCLTLSFLFSTFPSLRFVPASMSRLCRRLTVEFLHYVIEARALRKVFVSIKGYYYQAEIKGQIVTWIVPHYFGFQPQSPDEVDFRIMATFVEFYNIVLGFINFRLYHALNICYPPKLLTPRGTTEELNTTNQLNWTNEEDLVSERVAALNQTLLRTSEAPVEEQVPEMDEFPVTEDAQKLEEMKREAERVKRLKNLFGGMKFFLSREVPREALCFMIRAVGGQASWDRTLFPGAIFDESDESITHQITDRKLDEKQHLSRYYIQPQWVFDCINARRILPVEKYFPGAILPPHLSPFDTEREGDYLPPEKRKFLDMAKGIVSPEEEFELNQKEGEEDEEGEEEDDEELDDEEEDEGLDDSEKNDSEEDEDLNEDEKRLKEFKKQMKVTKGEAEVVDELKRRDDETKEQWRLRTMMIKNKHKRLYRKMMDSRRKRRKVAEKLATKRQQIDESTSKRKGKKVKSN